MRWRTISISFSAAFASAPGLRPRSTSTIATITATTTITSTTITHTTPAVTRNRWHVPSLHAPDAQSPSTAHRLPAAHFALHTPPQSTSASSALSTPS